MYAEFKFILDYYILDEVSLEIDESLEVDARLEYETRKIVLPSDVVCKNNLISLLHEIRHIIQIEDGFFDSSSCRALYEMELDAEFFAIEAYEFHFGEKHGSAMSDPWRLAPFKVYKRRFMEQFSNLSDAA